MKIGIVGPIWYNIPPDRYGGTESVVFNLTNGLTKRGHAVTLFGPGSSKVNATLHPTIEKPIFDMGMDWNNNITAQMYHITEVFDRRDEFDIIHMHLNKSHDYMSLPLAVTSSTPVVFTLHFPIPQASDVTKKGTHSFNRQDRLMMLKKYKHLPVTTISNAQQKPLDMNFIRTVYNSFEIEEYHFMPVSDDYFVWLGRVQPVKGAKEAILAAKQAGVKLKLLGALDTSMASYMEYFEKEVKPLIDGKQIEWLGEADMKMKNEVVGKAKALLNPIQWEEPFGLVMAEAQAMGTPVISLDRGAAAELIEDGVTGYVPKTMEEFVKRIGEVGMLDRKNARMRVEKLFNQDQMISGYEDAYETVVTNWEAYRSKENDWLRQWKAQNKMIQ